MRISNSCARWRQKLSLEPLLEPVSARLPAICVAGVPEEPATEPVLVYAAGVVTPFPLLVVVPVAPVLTGEEVGELIGVSVTVPALVVPFRPAYASV